MRGRKTLPDNVRELRGNPGKRPRNHDAPQPLAGRPELPARLRRSKNAVEMWEILLPQLEAMGVVTQADGPALALACDVYAKWCRKGTAALAARFQSLLAEFGLTPAARARLRVPKKAESGYGDFRQGPASKARRGKT